MNRTFFIADTHFKHKNILKYCDRPFPNINEHDKTLIQNWNKTVSKGDLVFMLGDFCLSGKDTIAQFGQQLNGRKVLVLGNHDGASMTTYYNAGFEHVSKWPIIYEGFILSHEPQAFLGGFLNIHGHIHNNDYNESILDDRNYFNVSVENIEYKPIIFTDILERIKQKQY